MHFNIHRNELFITGGTLHYYSIEQSFQRVKSNKSFKKNQKFKMTAIQQQNCIEWIPALIFAINTTVSTSTQVNPYSMMFGQEASMPLNILVGPPGVTDG